MFLHNTSMQFKDVRDALAQLDEKEEMNAADEKAVEELKQFAEQYHDQNDEWPLIQDELVQLAKILIAAKDFTPPKQTINSMMLNSLRNLFGMQNLKSFAGKPTKTAPQIISRLRPLQPKKSPPSNAEHKESQAPNAEHKEIKAKGEVRKIKITPRQVSLSDIDNEGRLKVTFAGEPDDIREKIKKIIFERHRQGKTADRISKNELKELLGKKPTCGVTYHTDETGKIQIYWVYKGKQHTYFDRSGKRSESGKSLGFGAFGTTKILQHDESGDWYTLKIKIKKITSLAEFKDDGEFENAKSVPEKLAKHRLVRFSPSKKEYQEEIVMKWAPCEELFDLVTQINERRLTPLFIIEVVNIIIQKIIDLHNAGYIHRDIKPDNCMIYLTMLTLIDYGASLMLNGKDSVTASIAGTPTYMDTDVLTFPGNLYPFTKKSDFFSLGLMIAVCLDLYRVERINQKKYVRVVTSSDNKYTFNNIISDKKERAACLKQLQMLTAPLATRPNDLKDCQQFFQQLFIKMRKETIVTACVIDVEEFLQADEAQRKLLITHAKQFEQHYFVEYRHEANKHSQKDLISLYKLFEDHYIYCDQVVRLERENLAELRNLLNVATAERNPGKNYEFTLVTGKVFSKEEQTSMSTQGIKLEACTSAYQNRFHNGNGNGAFQLYDDTRPETGVVGNAGPNVSPALNM